MGQNKIKGGEKKYSKQLEGKEIAENTSKVLTSEEGRTGTAAGQLEKEKEEQEMMERTQERKDL